MELPSNSQATPKRLPNLPGHGGTRWDIVRTLSGHPDVRIRLISQHFLRSEGWDTVGHGGTWWDILPNKYGGSGKYGTNPNCAAYLELMRNNYNALAINNQKDG